VFAEVSCSVDALEAVAHELDPLQLDGRDAAALVELATRGERICVSIKALAARRVEETKVWRDSGHRSAAHWVAKTTGETVGSATRTLQTARALDQFRRRPQRSVPARCRKPRRRRSQAQQVLIRTPRQRCWRRPPRRA
jgi:hypothetical protein